MNLEPISKRLAYMLRHSREPLYVNPEGWAEVALVLEVLSAAFSGMNREILDRIVAQDRKQRYAFNETGTHIRANQGHSIPGVTVQMTSPTPPERLYHGTATRFLPGILAEGLKPMSRQFVHLSGTFDTAVSVGKRHGKPVVLEIRAGDFVRDGHKLLLSANGVWQAEAVPPEYFVVKETL